MNMANPTSNKTHDLELRAELLKERIYATLALLAVLLTVDADSTTPFKSAALVGGTALSLWLASLVSSQMSHRIIMRQMNLERTQLELRSFRRSPLLLAAVMPVLLLLSAGLPGISMQRAIDLAVGFSLLLLIGWSLLAARAMRAGPLVMFAVAAIQLGIGLAIVAIKMVVSD